MSLPEEDAGKVMSRLTAKQVEAVSIEIAKLGLISTEEQEIAIKEFADASPGSIGAGTGGLDLAKSLVERALGKNATATIESVRQSDRGDALRLSAEGR